MQRFLIIFLLLQLIYIKAFTCTGFYIAKGEKVFAGNNEDYPYPLTKIWIVPKTSNSYGRIYFGFDDFNPQGGVNEKGLFFDGFATDRLTINVNNNKPAYDKFFDDIRDEIMATCANVKEVIDFLNNYNLSNNNLFENGMLFYGDSEGNSVIVDGGNSILKNGNFQVVTNFHVSKKEEITCNRYLTATRMLDDMVSPSVEACKDILDSTHTPITIYSQVYDLTNMKIHLYNCHNFNECHVIDIKEELSKGPAYYDLPTLFNYSQSYESFKEQNLDKRYLTAFKSRYNKEIGSTIDKKYMGDYYYLSYQDPGKEQVNINDSIHLITIGIDDKGVYLRENYSSARQFRIYPETRELYFYFARSYRTNFTFISENDLEIVAQTYYPVNRWIMKLKKYAP